MKVKISVVTPSFNQARYLEETIRSVVSQRDEVHEYFVYDGGSTDGSVDIIKKYATKIDYWISEKDKGQSDAIHKGFSRATGDVLLWLNSDDVVLPGALHKVRDAFESHPEWDVLTGYYVVIDQESRIRGFYRVPRETRGMLNRWGIVHVCQQTCFFRRSLYQKTGGLRLDLHCMMDAELWYRMFDAGATWGHIPEYLGCYRAHPLTKGSSWGRKYAEEKASVQQQYPAYRPSGLRRVLGMNLYRSQLILSGRYLTAAAHTWRNRGKKITEVFGEWVVPHD